MSSYDSLKMGGNFLSKILSRNSQELASKSPEANMSQSEISQGAFTLADYEKAIKDRDQAIKERDEAIKDRDHATKEHDHATKELWERSAKEFMQAEQDHLRDLEERAKVIADREFIEERAVALERNEERLMQQQVITGQRNFIESQFNNIQKLEVVLRQTKIEIEDRDEQINSAKKALEKESKKNRAALNKMHKKHQEERKLFIPLFQIGHNARELALSFDAIVVPQDLEESSWRGARICNCAMHAGRPISDAVMILYNEFLRLRPQPVADVFHQKFQESYCVPPQVVLDNYEFRNFQALMRMHEDMRQFKIEGSAKEDVATACMEEMEEMIAMIYPQGLLKDDKEFTENLEANTMFKVVTIEHNWALAKHHALRLEEYRVKKGIQLSFDLLDVVHDEFGANSRKDSDEA